MMSPSVRLLPQYMHVYDVLKYHARFSNSYLGVGVQEGECVRSVVTANPRIAELVLCDTWGRNHGGTGRGDHTHIEVMLADLKFDGDVLFLNGESQTEIPNLPKKFRFDFAFVDGDHGELAAFDDFVNVWPHVNWAMIIHDIFMPPVRAAYERWRATVDDVSTSVEIAGGTGTLVVYR